MMGQSDCMAATTWWTNSWSQTGPCTNKFSCFHFLKSGQLPHSAPLTVVRSRKGNKRIIKTLYNLFLFLYIFMVINVQRCID